VECKVLLCESRIYWGECCILFYDLKCGWWCGRNCFNLVWKITYMPKSYLSIYTVILVIYSIFMSTFNITQKNVFDILTIHKRDPKLKLSMAWILYCDIFFFAGITGQDGSYLAELLIDKNYEVHGIVRRASQPNTARIEHLYADKATHKEGNMILHYGDLTDSTCLVKIINLVWIYFWLVVCTFLFH